MIWQRQGGRNRCTEGLRSQGNLNPNRLHLQTIVAWIIETPISRSSAKTTRTLHQICRTQNGLLVAAEPLLPGSDHSSSPACSMRF